MSMVEDKITTSVIKQDDFVPGREQRLDQAAYELSDELWSVKDKLEKAYHVIGELTDKYFRNYNSDDLKDHSKIAWEFSINAVRADIVNDYVWQAKQVLEELEVRTDRAAMKRKHSS